MMQEVVDVEAASCRRRQEPRLMRSKEECSIVGADGRKKGEVSGPVSRSDCLLLQVCQSW